MSIVDKFGEKVGEIAENDPVKARNTADARENSTKSEVVAKSSKSC